MQDEQGWAMSVPEAGRRYYGAGRDASYFMARTGQMPGVVRVGRKLRVLRPVLERALLGEAGRPDSGPRPAA